MARDVKVQKGENFQHADFGALTAWIEHEIKHPKFNRPVPGKVFLRPHLGLTGMEVSLGVLPPGTGIPFLHRHQTHEELYIFVRGQGQFQVDGEVIDVREGTAIRVAPQGARAWRNNSKEPLYYVVVQAPVNGFEAGSTDDGRPVDAAPAWPGDPGSAARS